MFSGQFQTRKRVALRGGSRPELSREQMLTRLRKEKEQRKRRLVEVESSIKIQAAWRAWVCVRNAKESVRREWCEEFGAKSDGLHLGTFTWRCVSRVVFFVDAWNVQDMCAFEAICRVLISKITNEPEALSSKTGSQGLDSEAVHKFQLLLEASFRILEERASEQADSLLRSDLSRNEAHGLTGIATFIEACLTAVPQTCTQVVDAVAQRLLQKGILVRLAGIVERSVKHKWQSIDGSILERIVLSILSLASILPPAGVESGRGAFQLLGLPSLKSLSVKLAAQGETLLRHALPFLDQLLQSQEQTRKALKLDTGSTDFQDLCLEVVSNLLELLPECLSVNSEAMSHRLAAAVTCFVNWVISQHVQLAPKSEDEMDTDEDLDTEPVQHFSSELRPCVAKLHEQQGKKFLLALTRALFSNKDMNASQGLSAFCELLNFVICTARDEAHLHGMLLTFALKENLVSCLWHRCIVPCWNVQPTAFPDNQLVEVLLAPLAVLCQVYSSFLGTAGEHEVCHEQIPLSLKEIYDPGNPHTGLITVLKKSLWQVAWAKSTSAPQTPSLRSSLVVEFPKTCGKLLRQLHDNCTRWNLAPADHFHVQSAQLVQFVTEASAAAVQSARDGDFETEQRRTSVILTHAPCLIPFHDRARIFQAHVDFDRAQFQMSSRPAPMFSSPARIRRNHLLRDGFDQLKGLNGLELRGRLRVEFIDEHGMVEAGVDGGGLFKDFIEELVKKGFDPEYGFFAQTEEQELYPNPSAIVLQPEAYEIISFLGRMLGKAVYDGILLELPLAHFFLKKFQHQLCDLHDLPSLDSDVYNSLIQLRSQKENVDKLGLRFTITDTVYGVHEEVELKPNGKQIAVTSDNVVEYVYRFADYRLNKEVSTASKAFLRGFFDVIQAEWVQMFNANELGMLISGSMQGLNMENLRRNTRYTGGYHDNHPVILDLWQVLGAFSVEEQRHFLRFVTGCSRAPLLGFEQLHPKMSIQMAGSEIDIGPVERLPTSATCVNLLKLPPYKSKEIMHQKLLYAISAKSGFYLS